MMPKIYRVFVVAIFFAYSLQAQQEPTFSFTMYFEDAVGNQDSLVIGYDTLADEEAPNPIFGEVTVSGPFDSVFEVRAMKRFDDTPPYFTYKKLVNHTEYGNSCASYGCHIFINAKYPPVTISYDSSLFAPGTCNENAVLTPDPDVWFLQQWWDALYWTCMGSTGVIIDSLYLERLYPWGDHSFYRNFDIEGIGQHWVPGFIFNVYWFGICGNIPTQEPVNFEAKQLRISPNPVSDKLSVELDNTASRDIFLDISDVQGRRVFSDANQELDLSGRAEIDVSQYPPGIYFVRSFVGRRMYFGKWVKM